MSLKAKIEAVIYASEEPVTLAQLVGLLGGEAQAELDALQPSLDLEAGPEDASTAAEPEGGADDAEGTTGVEAVVKAIVPDAVVPDEPSESVDTVTPMLAEDAATEPSSDVIAEVAAETEPAAAAAEDKKVAREKERRLREYFRLLLDQLISDYANGDRGLEIREVAGGFRLATKPEYHDAVRGFVKSLKPPLKLSLQALETLAVVAYKQPVTAPEVSEIRGVDSGGVLGSLMARKLIQTAGRKQVIGRPMLYKTSREFLVRFGLKDINELPSIEEFEKMAGELNNDMGAVQEEIPMEATSPVSAGETSGVETSMGEETTTGTETGESAASPGGSAPLDELNAVPPPTHVLHETPEEMLSDDSTAPEGSGREPEHATKPTS
jgi:segregation and condensation protein B